ncbi:glycerophosphodiester phosphodiesterase [Streptomyces sp. GC420]|uniref:glycerophosphodiester phosphodiesterase n=1 Tax=Streptomyces sp. GC420 TaxID=2697568 RepID=UPI0014151B95|nr:glycerophosphodiester phosphodiesterase [Streptomyces sp. GC420]NBM15304.1 glycerophosphodiester phosphodiesterase [Streptomyces sp. GC420]
MRTVTAVGHRGDPYRFRENTVASLRSALDRGADAVEVDVRLTRDRVPVLLHDGTLSRLWRHDRAVAEVTAGELRDLGGGELPTLRDALAATGRGRVMVDLPGGGAAWRETLDTVRECGARDRVYYCGDASAMLRIRGAEPGAEIALTWTSLAPPRPSLLAAVRPRWLNYRFSLLSRELVERVHARGLLVSAWTPDTRRSMARLVSFGVDSVTSNRIDVLCSVRDGPRGR